MTMLRSRSRREVQTRKAGYRKAVGIALFSVAFAVSGAQELDDTPGVLDALQAASPARDERVQALVSVVKEETLIQSLANLVKVEPYFWPGASFSNLSLIPPQPLPAELGARDAEAIMGNRRFLKVYEELKNLPQDEAAILVSKEIAKTLPAYAQAYEQKLTKLRELLARQGQPGVLHHDGVGFSRQASENPDGRPTYYGLRYKLLALVWCAGALELREADDDVRDVTRYALEQRDACYTADEPLRKEDQTLILYKGTLYNRQILATALLGACAEGDSAQVLRKTMGVPWKSHAVPAFDAPYTVYDVDMVPGLRQAPEPEATATIEIAEAVSDAEFDILVKAIESVEPD